MSPSQAENGTESDNVHSNPVVHTATCAIKSKSNCFSLPISDRMEGDNIIVVECLFIFETYGKRVAFNKTYIVCEVNDTSVTSLLENKIQLPEEALYDTAFTCRREYDTEIHKEHGTDDMEHHMQIALDSEDNRMKLALHLLNVENGEVWTNGNITFKSFLFKIYDSIWIYILSDQRPQSVAVLVSWYYKMR